MNVFSTAFLAALTLETSVRLWLASRQIAAMRAHRGRVPPEFESQIGAVDQQRAADYTVARTGLGRIATVVDALIKLALTVGGGLTLVDAAVNRLGWSEPWRGCAVLVCVFALLQLLGMPLTLWRTFRIEARFGFNRMSPWLFVVDGLKGVILGVALGLPLIWVTLSLMQRAGSWWWVSAWLVWLAATLALTWAAPRFIAPLFNRFTPITDQALTTRVEALLERCGFAAAGGVFVMDGSRRSAHGNAYFTGIGRNKRIVFFDTLLARMEVPEVEAVLAHELGHFRLHHVRQRLITSTLGTLVGLGLLGWLAAEPAFYAAFGVVPSAQSALILFFLTIPCFTFLATPIGAWWSRRQELAADEFAAAHANPAHLVTALTKLYRDNATTLTPDRWHSGFYDSHPSAIERIARLRRLTQPPADAIG